MNCCSLISADTDQHGNEVAHVPKWITSDGTWVAGMKNRVDGDQRLVLFLPVKQFMIFGPCQETSNAAITLNQESKLYSPREESFPIPLKYIDVSRTTHTNLDVKQEKRIEDYWNIDGSRDLSDPWTGFTQFTLLDEKPPDGYMWSEERLTRKQLTSRPDNLWPELWKSMGKHACQAEGEAEVV